jgi:hypothetical protein
MMILQGLELKKLQFDFPKFHETIYSVIGFTVLSLDFLL